MENFKPEMSQHCYNMVSKSQNVIYNKGYIEIAWPSKEHLRLWTWGQMPLRALTSCVTPGSLHNLSELQLLHLRNENNHAYLRKLLWRLNEILYQKPLGKWLARCKPPLNNVCFCFQPFAHSLIWNPWRKQRWGLSILAGALSTQAFGTHRPWLRWESCR